MQRLIRKILKEESLKQNLHDMINREGLFSLVRYVGGVENLNDTTVLHYLHSYSKKEFFNGFRKINFDLIYNLIKWTEKENCFDLVKENYEYMLKKVNHQDYDYYSNKSIYRYNEEIREEFRTMYREIVISKIL
jgi:hypothetical protein